MADKDNFDPLLAGIAIAMALKKNKKKKIDKKPSPLDDDFDLEASINEHFEEED